MKPLLSNSLCKLCWQTAWWHHSVHSVGKTVTHLLDYSKRHKTTSTYQCIAASHR